MQEKLGIISFVSSIIDFNSDVYEQKRHRCQCKINIKFMEKKKSLHNYSDAGGKNSNLSLKYLLSSDISDSE